MTPQELATRSREFLIRTEKQSAVLLVAEFEAMKTEISNHLLQQNLSNDTARALSALYVQTFLDKITSDFSARAASIVSRAQTRVINFTSGALKRFLPQISSSIFAPDREAIQKLIGRTQTGTSLVKFFQRFKPVVAARAKQIFIEAFAAGESSETIARRLVAATDAEKFRVLTISRTETNEAYRAASREFYQAADIKKYVWLSVLDPRTCLICWHLHGQQFKASVKVFSHVNCRCVLVPLIKGQPPIETGFERFIKLEKGYQKQILGGKRFEMFQAGKDFNDFVGSRFDAQLDGSRVQRFFVKNLSDLM